MRLFFALLAVVIFAQCANQTSPNGGPQDKRPPELLSSNPKNNQRNFKGEKIELTFDEYIKLKDPSEEIMISPTVGKETKFQVKKNKLVIILKQKLVENATYNISFRDGVQDIN
ncbi:MAG: Ig-like domain-containing protein, partial [Cyclobacteriaceae bacterium]|nr:Ig-like domain-containing protein [Cyclobacteriaceae bacterium]